MRILIVGHTYVVPENQKKIQALAAAGSVDVALVIPRTWPDWLVGTLEARVAPAARFSASIVPAWWAGREQFYVYRSADLGFKRFQPDVVYVEQGAGAFVYAQTLIYRNLYAPRAKAAFFTWWNLPYRARWPLSAVERFNLRQSHGGVAGNRDAVDVLRARGFRKPLLLLPQLGVDPVAFQPRAVASLEGSVRPGRLTVGFVGRFVEEKGLSVLLAALARVSFEFDLLMLGRGPIEAEVRAFAAAQAWTDRLRIVPSVCHDEVPRYLNGMDVLVLPSVDRPSAREQFGHVLIEAMACGVPVIGSTCGEIPSVIGSAGVVVPQGDPEALAAALSRVAASPTLRRELGQAGRRRVHERFTHERIAQQLLEFLRSL